MPEIDWRQLPPLASLRAFEATARLNGFSAAARSLNVTPAAVAQQVRALETDLSIKLVKRDGRGVVLTAAGRQLASPLKEAFSQLANGVEQLRATEQTRGIKATTTTYIVDAVIAPKIWSFWKKHPDIPVTFAPGACLAPVDFEGFAFGIRVGAPEDWPDYQSEFLLECETILAASPELAASDDPQNIPWMLGDKEEVNKQTIRNAGLDADRIVRRDIGDLSLEIEAAKQGVGAIIAAEVVIRRFLEDGSLVKLDLKSPPNSVYHVILPNGPIRPSVRTFVDWLKASLAEDA